MGQIAERGGKHSGDRSRYNSCRRISFDFRIRLSDEIPNEPTIQ